MQDEELAREAAEEIARRIADERAREMADETARRLATEDARRHARDREDVRAGRIHDDHAALGWRVGVIQGNVETSKCRNEGKGLVGEM